MREQEEQRILDTYHAFWNIYFKGNIEDLPALLHEEIKIIGTSGYEVFNNKEELMAFYRSVANEMKDSVELRNRNIRIIWVNDTTVLIDEFAEIYVIDQKTWHHFGQFRCSSQLIQHEGHWLFTHQHASFPDMRSTPEDYLGVENLRTENLLLKKAVAERTAELENRNQELEIESALERVRTVAMGMRTSEDMLSVCESISIQLEQLNVPGLRNVQTAIVSQERIGYYNNYQYFTAYQKGVIEQVEIEKHPRVKEMIHRMQSSPDAYFPASFTGKELDEWRQYRNEDHQFPDPILEQSDAVYFHFYSIGKGGLGISTYQELSPEGLNLFHRFRNVFALAYQRFRDIEQAEAQTREAQIEASLERVRSRSMAMQQSEELSDVVKLLYQELDKLKASNDSTDIEIGLIDENTGYAAVWAHFYQSDGTISTFNFPIGHLDVTRGEYVQWKNTPVESRNTLFVTSIFAGERIQKLYKDISAFPELEAAFQPLIEAGIEQWVTHNAYFSHGLLTLQGTEPYPEETLDIQRRFARVFEQT